MKYTYSAGDTEYRTEDCNILSNYINRLGEEGSDGSHGEIICVHSHDTELRDLIVRLLNEHEESEQRTRDIREQYNQLNKGARLLLNRNPWLEEDNKT